MFLWKMEIFNFSFQLATGMKVNNNGGIERRYKMVLP